MELRNPNFRVPTWSLYGEGHTDVFVKGENTPDTAESQEPVHAWKSQSREPGDPIGWCGELARRQHGQRTVQRVRLP